MLKINQFIRPLLLMVPFCISCGESNRSRNPSLNEDGGSNDNGDTDSTSDNTSNTGTEEEGICGDNKSFKVLEGGYVCAGAAHGHAWTSTGQVSGGTIDPSDFSDLTEGGDLCVSGTTATDYSSLGILGVSANQEVGSSSNGTWTPVGNGIDVDIKTNGSFPLRFQVNASTGDYCTEIGSGSTSVKWSDLTKECWTSGGAAYNGKDPIELIMIMVPGDQNRKIDFDFCLEELIAGVGAPPTDPDPDSDVDIDDNCSESDKTICSNDQGNHCGYAYEFWQDNEVSCMKVESGGGFSIDWTSGNNVLARKGIRPGSRDLVVTYDADWNAGGVSYLGVYGWTKNPLIEYYIIDNWGDSPPPGVQSMDSIESDGGTYNIYRTQRVDQPSIEGTKTFYQYWSVRSKPRTSGSITVGNHFDAWEDNNLELGSLYEVSMLAEGFHSIGSADVRMSME